MKITFVACYLRAGGAERTISYLANYLVEKGHKVDIILYGYDDIFYSLDKRINLHLLNIHSDSNKIFLTIKAIVKRRIEIHKKLLQIKPDLIFCMLLSSMPYVVGEKYPIITSERSNPLWMKNLFKRVIRWLVLKFSDGIVFQTSKARNYYKYIKDSQCIIIPNAVYNDYFNYINRDHKEKTISAMGSLKPEKDYDTLFFAFKDVLLKHPSYVLHIYGDGLLKNSLKNLATELNIYENVVFDGNRKDALFAMQNTSCYVLSSISEGMPNALMEAMAVGIPCVATNCNCGPSELIMNGVNGLLVEPKNPKKLSEAICYVIENEDFSNYIGNNAKQILTTNSVLNISLKYEKYMLQIYNKYNDNNFK